MAKKKEKKLGWHFLPSDKKLTNGDGRLVEVGKTLSIPKSHTPRTCGSGMHASDKISQACHYKAGPVLCRVEVSGDISYDHDKFAGRSRKVLWMKEITKDDLRKIFKELLGATLDPHDSIERSLSNARHLSNFDKVLERWAAKNGLNSAVAAKPPKAELTLDHLVEILNYRVVMTGKEIKALFKGSGFDLSGLDDLIDDLCYDHDVRRVDNFTKSGDPGFLRKMV